MKSRPHILITNDDGIFAPGIKHLRNALKDMADLTVIAPSMERSATSLSITLREPLRIDEVKWSDNTNVWSINGTPADCVKMALNVVMDNPPDLLVSGINRGSNSGRNVLYSGTVACAIEGVLHDIPSIAFSCYDYHDPEYHHAEQYIPKIVQHVIEHPLPEGTLLNVNFPTKLRKRVKGIKLTRQGKEFWMENPDKRSHPAEGHHYYWLGAKIATFDEEEDCDVTWLKKGYVAAVPIHIGELTDHGHLSERKSHFEELF